MRKSILVALISAILLTGVSVTAFAAEGEAKAEKQYKYPYNESAMTYRNVLVYKILDQRDAYIVMYSKGHRDVGSVAVPKRWYSESPKKLSFRPLSTGMTPYMTVLYRDGSFDKVILTLPTSRAEAVWGVADSNIQVDASVDTLDIVY